ncbi:MAG: twin-arginine translocation signal domain-containing protein [Patescibacteria group bacterium]
MGIEKPNSKRSEKPDRRTFLKGAAAFSAAAAIPNEVRAEMYVIPTTMNISDSIGWIELEGEHVRKLIKVDPELIGDGGNQAAFVFSSQTNTLTLEAVGDVMHVAPNQTEYIINFDDGTTPLIGNNLQDLLDKLIGIKK